MGINHDSTGNKCPKDGYIMSPSRGVNGESQWSSCSRTAASTLHKKKTCLLDKPSKDYKKWTKNKSSLDHSTRYSQTPGRQWTARKQCQILLKDKEAYVDTLKDCCKSLKCRSKSKADLFLSGPALDGTKCGRGRECKAGDCLTVTINNS